MADIQGISIKKSDSLLFTNREVNPKKVVDKEVNKTIIIKYANKVREHDTAYHIPEVNTSACYIATAVYGSYDCPEVWNLRRFRDYTLAETWYGRSVVKFYYTISPTIVKWFGKSEWFGKVWRAYLNRFVNNLNQKGVENTPYHDK